MSEHNTVIRSSRHLGEKKGWLNKITLRLTDASESELEQCVFLCVDGDKWLCVREEEKRDLKA